MSGEIQPVVIASSIQQTAALRVVGKSATGMQNVVADEAHAWHQASVQHVFGIVQNFGERFNGRLREGILLPLNRTRTRGVTHV